MRKVFIFTILFLLFAPLPILASGIVDRLQGRIVLQTEENGEAWYIDPILRTRVFLGRPADAFRVMRERGLGISNTDFSAFRGVAPEKLRGRILLQVELNGEAWYVNPVDLNLHYLGRPTDAFDIMRNLGLGISNSDIVKIPEYGQSVVRNILQDVPFTPQAPFGEWSDTRQQDGCEESSSLMAVSWARSEDFDLTEARDIIIAISDYEKEKYGTYKDTSAYDTLNRIIKGYFNYNNARLENNISLDDIRSEIFAGNLVIVPANGRVLGNPYFTQPGPPIHMLVIIGYDVETQEFITNEPGTRHGESYRYDEDILFDAVRDYPTGNHILPEGVEKNMIVVWK